MAVVFAGTFAAVLAIKLADNQIFLVAALTAAAILATMIVTAATIGIVIHQLQPRRREAPQAPALDGGYQILPGTGQDMPPAFVDSGQFALPAQAQERR